MPRVVGKTAPKGIGRPPATSGNTSGGNKSSKYVESEASVSHSRKDTRNEEDSTSGGDSEDDDDDSSTSGGVWL